MQTMSHKVALLPHIWKWQQPVSLSPLLMRVKVYGKKRKSVLVKGSGFKPQRNNFQWRLFCNSPNGILWWGILGVFFPKFIGIHWLSGVLFCCSGKFMQINRLQLKCITLWTLYFTTFIHAKIVIKLYSFIKDCLVYHSDY